MRGPSQRLAVLGIAGIAGIVLFVSCAGDATEPILPSTISVEPSTFEIDDGDSVELSATIRDASGEPMDLLPAGAVVRWSVDDDAVLSLSNTSGKSVSAGGLRPGAVTVTASVEDIHGTADGTILAVPTAIEATGGDEQEAAAGEALPESVGVRVTDRHGDGVEGVEVAFAVTGGGGSLSDQTVITDADGDARVDWTLGTEAGENEVEATAHGLDGSPVAFTATGTPGDPATVTIEPTDVEFDAVSDTAHLSVTVEDKHGNEIEAPSVEWSSADADIASVDEHGIVTAMAAGRTDITATSGEADANVSVAIEQVPENVTIKPAKVEFDAVGATRRLSATVEDKNGNEVDDPAVDWSSAEADIASVNADGMVTARAAGTTEIMAASGGADASASVAIEQAPENVAIKPAQVEFDAVGATKRLSATVEDKNGNEVDDPAVDWSSANADIASVNADGVVTAKAAGTTKIMATSGGADASASVAIEQVPENVEVELESDTVLTGDTLQASAEAFDSNGNPIGDAEFAWSSSDESVATVDAAGRVTAQGEGEATITATADDASAGATIGVNPAGPTSVTANGDPGRAVTVKPSLDDDVTLEATGQDGTVYTLMIPARAVPDTTLEITMTPVRSIDGLPLRDFTAAVDLQPEGLRFNAPDHGSLPLLTIELTEPADEVLGYGYHGEGDDFHLRPYAVDGNTVSRRIAGFSGYGVGEGDSSHCAGLGEPDEPLDAALQTLECLNKRIEEGEVDAEDERRDFFGFWYHEWLAPELEAAATDAARLEDAIAHWFTWQNEVFEADEPGAVLAELDAAEDLVAAAFEAGLPDFDQLCVDETDPDRKFALLLETLFMNYFLVVTGRTDDTLEDLEAAACGGVLYAVAEIWIAHGENLPDTVGLTVGDTTKLEAMPLNLWNMPLAPPQTIYADSGPTPELGWTSSAESVATVAESGPVVELVGVAEGAATITVETRDGLTETVEVTVGDAGGGEVSYVIVEPDSTAVGAPGDTAHFSATAYDSDDQEVEGVDFVWSTSDTGVAIVDENGIATAEADGIVEIFADHEFSGNFASAILVVGDGG